MMNAMLSQPMAGKSEEELKESAAKSVGADTNDGEKVADNGMMKVYIYHTVTKSFVFFKKKVDMLRLVDKDEMCIRDSVYSASKLATEEFPNFDVGQRSAASIARRLQDPLAELVKIDPKAIGVGQYQHDMNQKRLSEALGGVVEDSVNKVGVDLNLSLIHI